MIGRLRKEMARQQATSEEFDRLVERLGESTKDLTADGNRGRPDVDLHDWAARRGLDHRGDAPQAGYLSVTCPWSTDVLLNVVRGELPGGAWRTRQSWQADGPALDQLAVDVALAMARRGL